MAISNAAAAQLPAPWLADFTRCGLACTQTAADGDIAVLSRSRLQLTAGGTVARRLDAPPGDWIFDRRADLRYHTEHVSVWAGGARVDGPRHDELAPIRARLEAGARLDWSRADLTVSAGSGERVSMLAPSRLVRLNANLTTEPDTFTAAASPEGALWSLAEVRGAITVGRWVVSTTVGRAAARGVPSSVWGSVGAAHRVARGTFMFLNAGVTPAPAIFGIAGAPRRNINVGLRFNTGSLRSAGDPPTESSAPAQLFLVTPTPEGHHRIRIRLAGAQRVELASDCTAWRPVAMSRVSADEWEATLVAAAGSHLVDIRVDGGPWIVPPGLVPKVDDFSGAVGVFVVE